MKEEWRKDNVLEKGMGDYAELGIKQGSKRI